MTSKPTEPSPTVAELMQAMMKRELYVIINTPRVPAAEMQLNLRDHLLYMIALEKSGTLFASGPLVGPDKEITGEGLTIIRADSLAQAEQIAGEDPFVIAGQRQSQVKRWIVNEGRVTISVDISDCTATLR